MHRPQEIVINTGPLIALVAALDGLSVLKIYFRVLVPLEVCQEILAGGSSGFAVAEFQAAHWLIKQNTPVAITPFLKNSLDSGRLLSFSLH